MSFTLPDGMLHSSAPADVPFTPHFDFRTRVTSGQYHVECHVFDEQLGKHVARVSPAGVLSVGETRTFREVADLEKQCSA